MVLWLTGMSGAGKSTIAAAIVSHLRTKNINLIQVDGDVVREVFDSSLGYDEASRKKQIERIQKISLFISRQGFPVIVTALYSDPILLAWNVKYLPNYYEVYVKTPISTLISRDTKGIYSKALNEGMLNVVGLDIPWNEPLNSDLVVATVEASPDEIAAEIIKAVPWMAQW
jgi:adenylylsulfate kinase-like enzyme